MSPAPISTPSSTNRLPAWPVTAIAMFIAIVIAIYVANRKGGLVGLIEGSVKSSASIPHLILAVGFLVAFSGAPFYLSGTAAILILAFVIMYISPGSIAAASESTARHP